MAIDAILIIRRDNIGDLLLSTPMISALRARYPAARIEMLVNSYNAPVLAGNPDIDAVHAYTKAKHSGGGKLAAVWAEFRLFRRLRRRRFDLVIHANPTVHARTAKLVRFLKAGAALGVVGPDDRDSPYTLPLREADLGGPHHAQRVMSLLRPLGITDEPGPMTLTSAAVPDDAIGLHLSSRRPCNRWPLARYVELARALRAEGQRVRVFWAPGSRDNAGHPGDDEMAAELRDAVEGLELCPTQTLATLIDGVASCRAFICCDGGTLHIAAALGKPLVAIFGCTDARIWGPWGTVHRTLHGEGDAANVAVVEVLAAAREAFPA